VQATLQRDLQAISQERDEDMLCLLKTSSDTVMVLWCLR
jgi:hypothetical protein